MPEFCKKCGAIMLPVKKAGKDVLMCKRCNIVVDSKKPDKITSKINPGKEVVIIDNKEETSTLPTVNVECPACNNNEAYWWQRQMRAADEPPTNFFRCKKCKHTWKEY